MVFRPATPGFLVTLTATILLAVVVFSVPYFKSVFFLSAQLSAQGIDGTITFGVLGYCLDVGSGPVCSKPSIGYQLDANALLGVTSRIDIPEVVVKWVTYALVLHVVALCFAAGASLFGLLAHVREFSMVCCSTCLSGIAASFALFAFIFDIVLFFLVKSRITAIGGAAAIGNGVWLTLVAWVLLFFAGCFYGFGQCCLRGRPRAPNAPSSRYTPPFQAKPGDGYNPHSDQMRLDAVKAEADRKARQRAGETGLPAFQEYESKPLRTQFLDEEEDDASVAPYRDNVSRRPTGRSSASAGDQRRQPAMPGAFPGAAGSAAASAAAGYAAAPRGTRAVDEYYAPQQQTYQQPALTYPPQPSQWQTPHNGHAQVASHYPEIVHPQVHIQSPTADSYGSAGSAAYSVHQQYPSADYAHPQRGTTYHSAHSAFPSTYSQDVADLPPPTSPHSMPSAAVAYAHAGHLPSSNSWQTASPYGLAGATTAASGSLPGAETGTTPAPYNPWHEQRGDLSAAPPSVPPALTPGRIATQSPYGATQPYSPLRQASSGPAPRGPRSPTSPTQTWPHPPPAHADSADSYLTNDLPPSYDGSADGRGAARAPREKS